MSGHDPEDSPNALPLGRRTAGPGFRGAPPVDDDSPDRLRAMIVGGEFMPNQRLVEAELVAALGVSRAKVRAALARLEHEGLVVSERNRGARVRLYTEAETVEITEARGVLEGLAARYAAQRATDADKRLLRGLVAEMDACVDALDLIAYSDANGAFHAELHRIARHVTVTRLLQTLRSQSIRFQHRGVMVPGRVAGSLAEHHAILDAVEAGDGDAAEARMRVHLANVGTALRQAMARRRQPPAGLPG